MHDLLILEHLNGVDELSKKYLGQVLPDATEVRLLGSASQLVYQ